MAKNKISNMYFSIPLEQGLRHLKEMVSVYAERGILVFH